MRTKRNLIACLMVPALVGAMTVTGCGDDVAEDLCGPCGTVAEGDVGISGNAKLDGFFKAVADLNDASVSIRGDFRSNIDALLEVYDVEVAADADLETRVGELVAAVEADVTASTEAGLTVQYAPPRCEAAVNVAVQAQAQCEAKAGCDAEVDPGNVSVMCEGKCEGKCEGECSGDLSCEVEAPSIECTGKCEGTCTVEGGLTCEGTCRGECDGTCSVQDADGQCAGKCDGTCEGACEFEAAAECSGTCNGSCLVDSGSAQCDGEVECNGSCSGGCEGSCVGEATPPSASVDCDASADCQAQAKAQASANVECSPPELQVGYTFKASLDASAKAAFVARLGELEARGAAIVQGFARYKALIDGEVGGQAVFETPPVVAVQNELEGVIAAGVEGELFADIPAGRITCVIPAMEASAMMLADIGTEARGTITAQTSFVTAFRGGFGG